MEESITEQAAHGIKWNYFSTITNAVIQIGGNIVEFVPTLHLEYEL